MHEVIKNVPVPKAIRSGRSPRRRYPFEDMDIGDMFFIPNKSKNTLTTQTSMAGKRLGRKFVTRLTHMYLTEDGWEACNPDEPEAVQGIGVWRTR